MGLREKPSSVLHPNTPYKLWDAAPSSAAQHEEQAQETSPQTAQPRAHGLLHSCSEESRAQDTVGTGHLTRFVLFEIFPCIHLAVTTVGISTQWD